MSEDDNQLIEKYLAGDETALAQLINRHLSSVFNFVSRFCQTSEADDLTQEIFIKVWKNLKRFDQTKNFKPWLFTIARRTVIDWLRKKKSLSFSSFDTIEESFSDNLVDPQPLAEEVFARTELAKDLERALTQIPPEIRAIVLLHQIEDFSFKEIAEMVKQPLNTVKSQYRRALIKLKESL